MKQKQNKIVEINSPALAGASMNLSAFKAWVKAAEETPTISLEQFKAKWATKKKKIISQARKAK